MPWNPEYYQPKIWNTGTAAKQFRLKNKSEPHADKKLINNIHNKWCENNGYPIPKKREKRVKKA